MPHLRQVVSCLLFILFITEARADSSCALIESPSGTASQNGQMLRLPVQLSNCEGVTVRSGTVVVCAQDHRDRLICRSLQKGDKVSTGTLRARPSGTGWTLALLDLLRGAEGDREAISRGPALPAAYLPQGGVLLLRDAFIIDFGHPHLSGIEAVEFRQGSARGPIVTRVPGVGTRSVSTAPFQRGQTYWWTTVARGNAPPAHGSFVVLDARRLHEARNAEAALATSPGTRDVQARQVMLAEWLYDRDFRFDAAQTLLAAGIAVPDARSPSAADGGEAKH